MGCRTSEWLVLARPAGGYGQKHQAGPILPVIFLVRADGSDI